MTLNALTTVPGSLAYVAQRDGLTLAESFLSAEIIVLLDQSGSMAERDARRGQTRYEVADSELARLQAANSGKIALICFSNGATFCPGGVPNRSGNSTNMAAALDFAHVADGTAEFVLISDGVPNDERAALAAARRFTSPIHVIFIGPEDDREGGRAFLERLAAAAKGRSFGRGETSLLADSVQALLLTA